ncbi:Peptidyl-prolyl cis-trans isomerase FKBP16-4, chloroplastic [Tetrabaena socialis]|uniref:peptidylprolyl isomerase n=1 Tax=Tetrabaena socialis TaxID=47790 RepID=A0A2J8A044_9CHLO|nr:Peptidyl-prolyl cis-trans isomerase FKBP16-4, chloroplastic [Tetrabaena socialis]|eukprot:PNH05901.1 Peptidyl-prolyl cis-trans isomerase FKBP16-4, chloroplastic [Tetrabaena socialis]
MRCCSLRHPGAARSRCLQPGARRSTGLRVVASVAERSEDARPEELTRRALLAGAVGAVALGAGGTGVLPASALSVGDPTNYKKELARRRRKIPEEDFTDGPLGLKFYDIEEGGGAEVKVGARVAVHYDIKWRGITFMTSRMGMGVTGGTPLGFNVGIEAGEAGGTLPGLDYGVRGMHVGGLRRVLVPPELGYGPLQVGEIPPNSTLTLDIELLSIKTNPLGYRTKLVEG